jgi:branched-chain amino acid transport system ATP-binding protein
MAALLKIEHLEVRYGDLIGVADVSLEVPKGSVVALLGSNGAGKTTTLNAIAGIVPVAKGTVSFDGASIGGVPAHAIVRKGIALSPEGWRLFTQQSVENNLLLGATPLPDRTRIPRLLERVYSVFPRLAERRHQRAGTMSGGERQMLAVGRALMSEPQLLMLDEPSLGLAPLIVKEIFHIISALRGTGVATLLIEQNARAALQISDYGYVLETGEFALEGPAAELAQNPRVIETYLGLAKKTA